MGKYDVEMKYRRVKKALKKLGLDYRQDGKHDTATVKSTGEKTTIPRHGEIDKFIVGTIIEFCIANGLKENEVLRVFGLK